MLRVLILVSSLLFVSFSVHGNPRIVIKDWLRDLADWETFARTGAEQTRDFPEKLTGQKLLLRSDYADFEFSGFTDSEGLRVGSLVNTDSDQVAQHCFRHRCQATIRSINGTFNDNGAQVRFKAILIPGLLLFEICVEILDFLISFFFRQCNQCNEKLKVLKLKKIYIPLYSASWHFRRNIVFPSLTANNVSSSTCAGCIVDQIPRRANDVHTLDRLRPARSYCGIQCGGRVRARGGVAQREEEWPVVGD